MALKASVVFAVLCGVFISGNATAEQAKITLRVADSLSTNHFLSENVARFWMDELAKRTGNVVDLQYFPAQQLGKAKDLLYLTHTGVVDISYVEHWVV